MYSVKLLFLLASATVLSYSLSAHEAVFNITDQVKKVLPSIVKIKVQKSEPSNDASELTATDTGGSGFILDDQHHIATNAHVIGDGKKIVIIDYQNKEYPAVLVAKDDKTDIAVLESDNFNTAVLSESNASVSLGEGVFTIGSPFSLGHSVSYGIAGSLNRFLPNYPYIRFIQIDAAVNPGNSGGGLFNLHGELIGMVTTYFSKQGNYTNIAFALPIADVHRIASALIKNKQVERGYFGAEFFLSERLSRKLGYKASVFISRIEPNSPADLAGLKSGDIITGINDTILDDGGELHRCLEQSRPGDTIILSLIRDKQQKRQNIKLGKQSTEKKETTNVGTADASEKMGLILREKKNKIEVALSYGLAKNIGFDPTDTIIEINGVNVNTIQEFNAHLSRLKDGEIALIRLDRNGNSFILPIGTKTALKGYSSLN